MKKGVKILIAVIAVIVVLGGVFAGLFFGGIIDYMKPARKTWTKQVQKALNLDGVKLTDYSETLEEYKDAYNKPFKANFTVSADVNIDELDEDVQKTINNSKVKMEMAQNRQDKKTYAKIALESKDEKILDAEFVQNGTNFGIASKDLYDKYITMSLEDIEKALKESGELDTTNLPYSANSLTELFNKASEVNAYDLLYISEGDLKDIQKRYKEVIKKSIDKKCFTKKANVKVDVCGKDVRAAGYYLTLTAKDFQKLIEDIADEVADDDTIAGIIADKYNLMADMSGEDKISKDDAKELIKEYAEQIKEYAKQMETSEDQAIQIAVYSRYGKPVRLEVNVVKDIDDRYDSETILSAEYGKKKDIYTLDMGTAGKMVVTNDYDKKKDDEKSGTLTLEMSDVELGKVDYELINKDSQSKIYMDIKISEALAAQANLDEEVSLKIDVNANGNWKKEPVDFNAEISGNYGEQKVAVKVEGKIEYTDDVSIPELKDSNSTAVLKLSETEQKELADKILKKASEVLPERLKKIGIDVKPEEIYNPNGLNNYTSSLTPGATPVQVTPSNPTYTNATEIITGKKKSSDTTLGDYTEIISVGFAGNNVVSFSVAMEFDTEEKAKQIYSAYSAASNKIENLTVSVEGKKFVMSMDAKTFFTQYNISESNASKDSLKSTLESKGYTVEVISLD